jgi:hypothetical protein
MGVTLKDVLQYEATRFPLGINFGEKVFSAFLLAFEF